LRLAIERQVVGVFGDQHMGDRRLGRQAALDQSRRRSGLHDDVLAGAAGVFGSADDEHPELGRHDVELFAHVLANPVQLAFAARADLAQNVNDGLYTRQMGGQRAAIGAPLARALGPVCRQLCLGCGRHLRLALLDVFEGEQQLIGRQGLGAAVETIALQVFDNLDEPL
jgi:hypothetical protein